MSYDTGFKKARVLDEEAGRDSAYVSTHPKNLLYEITMAKPKESYI